MSTNVLWQQSPIYRLVENITERGFRIPIAGASVFIENSLFRIRFRISMAITSRKLLRQTRIMLNYQLSRFTPKKPSINTFHGD